MPTKRDYYDILGIGRNATDEDIKKAEDKRGAVEENLDRIGIIIDEIKKQLRSLEKERGSALKYKELKDSYDHAKAQSAYKKKDMAESEIASIHNQIEGYAKKETEHEEKAPRKLR